MVKLSSPLYGTGAKGPIKNAGSFYMRQNLPFFRSNTYRKDYERNGQKRQRGFFRIIVAEWHALSDEQKNFWNSIAEWPNTGYSVYMGSRLAELTGKAPAATYSIGKYGQSIYGG